MRDDCNTSEIFNRSDELGVTYVFDGEMGFESYRDQLAAFIFARMFTLKKRQALSYPGLINILMKMAERFAWGNFINEVIKAF